MLDLKATRTIPYDGTISVDILSCGRTNLRNTLLHYLAVPQIIPVSGNIAVTYSRGAWNRDYNDLDIRHSIQ